MKHLFGLHKTYDPRVGLTYLRVDVREGNSGECIGKLQEVLGGVYRGNIEDSGYNLVSEYDIDTSMIRSLLTDHGFEYSPKFEEEIQNHDKILLIDIDPDRNKMVTQIFNEWEEEMRILQGRPHYRYVMSFPEDIQDIFRENLGIFEEEHIKPDSFLEVFVKDGVINVIIDGYRDLVLEALNPKLQDSILDAIEDKKYI